jgi:hypothetical protein
MEDFFLNERHKIVPISLKKRGLQPASRKAEKQQGHGTPSLTLNFHSLFHMLSIGVSI